MLGNIRHEKFPFDYEKDSVSEFELVDKFILAKLQQVINDSIVYYDEYDFASAVNSVFSFLTIDLSSFYLDIAKDILYCDAHNSLRRRQVLTVIHRCFDALIRILAPILPHTMDELFSFYTNEETSIHLQNMPKVRDYDKDILKDYEKLMELRDDVLKALESARASGQIGSSQEASVDLFVKDEIVKSLYNKLSKVEKNRFFIVSNVNDVNNKGDLLEFEVSYIKVNVSEGVRCDRCWNRYDESKIDDNNLCPRCVEAINEYEKAIK